MSQTYYVEQGLHEDQFLSLELASAIGDIVFSIFFYPEVSRMVQQEVLQKFECESFKVLDLLPSTYYEGERMNTLVSNATFFLNKTSIATIKENFALLKKNADSILFYRKNEVDWLIAEIFHEQILLTKEDNFIKSFFETNKIAYSKNAPDWW